MTNKEDITRLLEVSDQLTKTQQRASDLLTSITTVLNDALVVNFSDEEKTGFLTNEVSAEKLWEGSDELWEQFVKTNLIERPKLKKKPKLMQTESYHDFLKRHRYIFIEINEIKNIKDPDLKRIAKLLRWLEKEKWYKLFCIVLNRYSNLQQDAENKVLSILTFLKDASIIALGEENPNRFSANDAKANKGWKLFIEVHLTENPKLNRNENFHDFLRRHRLIFLAINNLENAKIPEGEKILELLFQLMEAGWDKLFCTVLDRYLISDVSYKGEVKLFDINGKSEKYYGRTLAQNAVKNNNVVILKELIKRGADLNTVALVFDRVMKSREDGVFFTAVHETVVNESYECMQILIDEACDLNHDKVKDSALHYAARMGAIKAVKLLVDNGAKLDEKDSKGKIPYQLVQKKHKHCMQYLAVEMRRREIPIPGETSKDEEDDAVELKSINVVTPSREDIPLHHAFPEGVLDLILSFLNNETIKKMRRTNHFFAEFAQKNSMWENFVKAKLTANPRLLESENFYNFLKRELHQEILLDYQKSKKMNLDDSVLFGLLQKIAETGWEKLFITVLDNNPKFDVNAYVSNEINKRYLIHSVVARKSTVMLRKLIDRKANLGLCAAGYVITGEMGQWIQSCGNNPLQEAVECHAHNCVKLLLAYKHLFNIDELTSDDEGQSALHLAAKQGDITSAKLLVEVGHAKLDQKNKKGNIPYAVAKISGHQECAAYLADAMEKANLPVPKESSLRTLLRSMGI